jgi:hypothetical protein
LRGGRSSVHDTLPYLGERTVPRHSGTKAKQIPELKKLLTGGRRVLSSRPLVGRRTTQPKCPRCQAVDLGGRDHRARQRPDHASQLPKAPRAEPGHAVADCRSCAEGFRKHELATDLSGNLTHLCPRCSRRPDRQHSWAPLRCARLPRPVRIRTRELREVTRKVIEQSQQRADHAGPLSRDRSDSPPIGLAVGAP